MSPVAADRSPLWLSDRQEAPAGRKYDWKGLKFLMSKTFSFLSIPDVTMYLRRCKNTAEKAALWWPTMGSHA